MRCALRFELSRWLGNGHQAAQPHLVKRQGSHRLRHRGHFAGQQAALAGFAADVDLQAKLQRRQAGWTLLFADSDQESAGSSSSGDEDDDIVFAGPTGEGQTETLDGGTGVDLRLVNPGFVATRLTAKNSFAMPAILTPEDAARRILTGLAGTRFEIAFPRAFVTWMKLLRLLPYRLYFPLVARLTQSSGTNL